MQKVCKPTTENIKKAVTILQQGGLVAFPTETVYGLGADAKNSAAVERIFSAKGRPVDHPVIVHLANGDQLKNWVQEITSAAQKLAQYFWPGPLTLVLPRAKSVLDCITGGQETIGIRIPQHPIAQKLLQAFGDGIAAPSANRFGHISPTRAEHVWQELDDAVDLILDGGECEVGIESTIVDVSSKIPRILRAGVITASQISAVLGVDVEINNTADNNTPRTSGMLLSHYAPQTVLKLIKKEKLQNNVIQLTTNNKTVVVLASQSSKIIHPNLHWITMSIDPAIYAHELYAKLRAADQLGCAMILVEDVPNTEMWFAVRDRLQKAAGETIL